MHWATAAAGNRGKFFYNIHTDTSILSMLLLTNNFFENCLLKGKICIYNLILYPRGAIFLGNQIRPPLTREHAFPPKSKLIIKEGMIELEK